MQHIESLYPSIVQCIWLSLRLLLLFFLPSLSHLSSKLCMVYSISVNVVSPTGCFFFFFVFHHFYRLFRVYPNSQRVHTFTTQTCCVCVSKVHTESVLYALYMCIHCFENRHTLPQCVRFWVYECMRIGIGVHRFPYMVKNLDRHSRFVPRERVNRLNIVAVAVQHRFTHTHTYTHTSAHTHTHPYQHTYVHFNGHLNEKKTHTAFHSEICKSWAV